LRACDLLLRGAHGLLRSADWLLRSAYYLLRSGAEWHCDECQKNHRRTCHT